MRGFVRLGGTGHRSGGVPGAIAPQVSVSGWARPRTPGQVERGLERLAWLGCGWQPGQGVRVRGPLAGHARVAALARDRGPGHGPPHFRRLHTPGRSRTAPAARRGPSGPAGCLVRSRPTTAVLQAAGCLISEGPVLRRAFTSDRGRDEGLNLAPPSKPDRPVSGIRLSGCWSERNGLTQTWQTLDCAIRAMPLARHSRFRGPSESNPVSGSLRGSSTHSLLGTMLDCSMAFHRHRSHQLPMSLGSTIITRFLATA